MPRYLDTLSARLKFARENRGMTQQQLATAAGLKQPDISKLEKGLMAKTTGIARLARALRVDDLWLEQGQGDEPNWVNVHHTNEGANSYGPAQGVSHLLPTIDPQHLQWESIVVESLPNRFMVTVRDESMSGPDAASLNVGDRAIFETERPPRPGRNVLVQDGQGNLFIREYRVKRPGHWQAIARNPAYAPLDSIVDQLTIVAVQTGHLY